MQRLALIILLCFISSSIQAKENPWGLMTQRDIQGIRDLLQENHPGPIDPQNHRYAEWLKDGFSIAMTRAESATSFSDYSADAIYIDNTYTMLPSGLTGLGYSMKVFRNRVRGNNEWYEPQIDRPGRNHD